MRDYPTVMDIEKNAIYLHNILD